MRRRTASAIALLAVAGTNAHEPVALGGRFVFVLPNRACLTCLDELDSAEIARWVLTFPAAARWEGVARSVR